jgi:hypothetical protein
MQDPLHIAGANSPLVAHAVTMRHQPFQHIGNRLDSPVRMPGKPGQALIGVTGMEVVQHQERIELGDLRITEQ